MLSVFGPAKAEAPVRAMLSDFALCRAPDVQARTCANITRFTALPDGALIGETLAFDAHRQVVLVSRRYPVEARGAQLCSIGYAHALYGGLALTRDGKPIARAAQQELFGDVLKDPTRNDATVRCSIFEGRLNEVQSELIRDDGGAFLARVPTLWFLPDVENYALRGAS